MDLRELTVVIFTLDRLREVRRQFKVLGSTRASVHVFHNGDVLADQDFLDSLPENFQYHYMRGGYAEQLMNSACHVDTPYAVVCDDDGLLIPSSLDLAVQTLNARPEIASVTGQSLSLEQGFPKVILRPSLLANFGRSIDEPNPSTRMQNLLDRYTCRGWYAVSRRNTFERLMNTAGRVAAITPNAYAPEVALELQLCLEGKSISIPVTTHIRNGLNPPVDMKEHQRGTSFGMWWLDPSAAHEHRSFLSSLRRGQEVFGSVKEQQLIGMLDAHALSGPGLGALHHPSFARIWRLLPHDMRRRLLRISRATRGFFASIPRQDIRLSDTQPVFLNFSRGNSLEELICQYAQGQPELLTVLEQANRLPQ